MALRLTQDDPFTWNSRGMALSDLGCFEEAAASFDKASELDRLDEMPCIYSCAAMIELKRFEPALARAERALSIAREQPLAWAVCGAAQAGLGRHRDALASVERATELGECSSFVYFKRAEILLAEDRWRDGAAALDEALRRFHSSGTPDTGNTVELVRILESHLNDESGLRLRAKVLVLVYFKHHALPALAHATVERIPDLISPAFEDLTARRWLETWRGLTGTQSEFRLPLRLIDAAVTYRETQDLRVLMDLPLEERVLLEPLLGVQVQATA